jgi:outer membrane protein assembly factor BamE
MQKSRAITLLALLSCLTLAGCSSFSFPGVYKLNIQQGNVVTQDMINQLQPGMTAAQVRYILGTPLLVDTFDPNRWEYLYSMQPGGGSRTQERLTVYFKDGVLSGMSGNFLPQAPEGE